MARRGDVLAARRRLGFGAEGRREHFVVLQADLLGPLETVVVAPLDDAAPLYQGDPLVVPIPAKEAGTRHGQVALVHLLTSVLSEKFEPMSAGRLSAKSMQRIDDVVRTILDV